MDSNECEFSVRAAKALINHFLILVSDTTSVT